MLCIVVQLDADADMFWDKIGDDSLGLRGHQENLDMDD